MRDRSALMATFNPATLGLPLDFVEQMKFSEFVATSDIVPKALQGKPANCFLVIQKALALNLPWDVAMSGIHVIEGKVTCGAKLLRMMMRKAGHDFDPHTVTDKEAKATLTLAHRPNKPIEVTYSIAEAQTAGLTGKQVWKNYAKSMLIAAVSRRAVDWYCPEVAMGLDLSDDTLAATFGEPVHATAEVITPNIVVPSQRVSPEQEDDEFAAGEPVADEQPTEDPRRAQALEVLEKARAATDVATLTRLGKGARSKSLLEQVVENDGEDPLTLKDALMARMHEVESGQASSV